MKNCIVLFTSIVLLLGFHFPAAAQMDCPAVAKHLKETLKQGSPFDLEFFLGKYGLTYKTCESEETLTVCVRCLDEKGARAIRFMISQDGRKVSKPQAGCTCPKTTKWTGTL